MYELFKNVIINQSFVLSDLLNKINAIWIQGAITDEQKTELITMAQTTAKVDEHVDFSSTFAALNARITVLEQKLNKLLENSNVEESTQPDAYAEFITGKTYYTGDRIIYTDGVVYECIAPQGAVCVWSPTDYPAYWKTVTE